MQARQHPNRDEGATTLVWIDSEEAIIVRWADRATVDRVRSEVPGRHRVAGSAQDDPAERYEYGGSGDGIERARREQLRRFVDGVAAQVPDEDDVTVVGPGLLRERLERTLRAADRHHNRHRSVRSAAAGRLTQEELVAHVRTLAGEAPARRGIQDPPG
jgi:hypothetical protein